MSAVYKNQHGEAREEQRESKEEREEMEEKRKIRGRYEIGTRWIRDR